MNVYVESLRSCIRLDLQRARWVLRDRTDAGPHELVRACEALLSGPASSLSTALAATELRAELGGPALRHAGSR